MAIKWIKGLPPMRNPRGHAINVAALNAHPGQWAVLREYRRYNGAAPTAARLRKRLPGYEFTSRSVDGGSVLYGRKLKGK